MPSFSFQTVIELAGPNMERKSRSKTPSARSNVVAEDKPSKAEKKVENKEDKNNNNAKL